MIKATTLKELIENVENLKVNFPEEYEEILNKDLLLWHMTRHHANSDFAGIHTSTGHLLGTVLMEDVKPT